MVKLNQSLVFKNSSFIFIIDVKNVLEK